MRSAGDIRALLHRGLGDLPRARILADLPLYTYHANRDPRGEVRRWYNGRRWALLDAALTAQQQLIKFSVE